MRIVDNFLPSSQFKELQSFMLGDQFPWFFNNYIHHPGDGQYQYTHSFYRYDKQEPSHWYYLIHDCLRKLRPKDLLRVKANSNPQTLSHLRGGYHIDISGVITSILYINTNNGWTEFKNGDKVECVENRMVIFDSTIKHVGFSCTNEKQKILIKFNYEG